MKKHYISPKAEIKTFESEDIITTSGVNTITSLQTKAFSVSDANTTWEKGKAN